MVGALHIVLLVQVLLSGAQRGPAECVRIERLSERVLLAYWLGTGRCNITAIKSEKGLVVVDTEMSPRIMAPIKARMEKEFGRNDWAYVINTHAHIHHAGGNSLFPGAVVAGHDNLPKDMEWLVRKQADPERKRKDIERSRLVLQNLSAALPRFRRNSLQAKRIQGEIEFYKRYIQDVKEGLSLEQATERMSVRNKFPEFREPPPGHWAHRMHERNIRNLWRILGREEQQSKTKQSGPPD